ncbi:MAG: NnrS family protein, partial [Verrucomicrobia bacterium]|nr:NnrS family protein [Verrucomicrobiota bacterium]
MSDKVAKKESKRGICVHRRRQLAKVGSYPKLCVAEPFRIFFPLAVLVSVVAVLLWPAMFLGWIGFYPREMHGRLLMEGFVGGFAFGFLGTALPNVLTTRRFSGWEVGAMLGLYLAMLAGHLTQHSGWGDGLFLLLLVVFGTGLARRFVERKDLPPPGFVLVAGGLLCAAGGVVLFLIERGYGVDLVRNRLANLLLFQGFLLLPVLGIGAFLFPRFFGTKNRHIFPDARTPPPGWVGKAAMAAGVGVLILASFVVEAFGWERTGPWMRFVLCGAYLSTETGWWRTPKKGGILPWGIRLGILFTLAAYLATGILAAHRVALDHLLYVGGFGMLALVVGTRVLLGHAGRSDLMERWLKPVVWLVVMVALAALTRVSANFLPQVMVSHWIYAALAWVAGVVV